MTLIYICRHVRMHTHTSVFLFVCLFVRLFLSVCLSLSVSFSVSVCLFVCLSVCLSLCLSVSLSLSLSLPPSLTHPIDDEFKWQSHISNICKIVSKNMFLMSQLKRYVNPQTLRIFCNSDILPHIRFSSTVWDGCGETHLNKLNSLHRRAAKLLLPEKNTPTDEKLKALSILPLRKQLYINKAVLMFKVNRKMTPSYIISLFWESNNRPNRCVLPKPRIDLYKTSLSFSGSSCWNSLPVVIKTAGTITRFKRELHQYLMTE